MPRASRSPRADARRMAQQIASSRVSAASGAAVVEDVITGETGPLADAISTINQRLDDANIP